MSMLIFQTSYILIIVGMLFGLYRLILGPNTLNRIVAFDFVAACVISLTTVYSIQEETSDYLELILIFSLLGFATVVAFMEVFFTQHNKESSDEQR